MYRLPDAIPELHDESRQVELRQLAHKLAPELTAKFRPLAIYLLGSAARGPCGPGSDLDLLIITDSAGMAVEQKWYYHTSGNPVDIRLVQTSRLVKASTSNIEKFANFCLQTLLPDYLHGAICLATDGSARSHAIAEKVIPTVIERRFGRECTERFVRLLRCDGVSAIVRATQVLETGYPSDAHAQLLIASKSLLESLIVGTGRHIRGAKKRPELLRNILPPTQYEWLIWNADIIGISHLRAADGAKIADCRRALRVIAVSALESLTNQYPDGRFSKLLVDAREHAGAVTEYYEPLLAAGFWRGVVNHIRVHSGVPSMPNQWCRALGYSEFPISTFRSVTAFPVELRDLWWSVSGLTDSRNQVRKLLAKARELAAAPVVMVGDSWQ